MVVEVWAFGFRNVCEDGFFDAVLVEGLCAEKIII